MRRAHPAESRLRLFPIGVVLIAIALVAAVGCSVSTTSSDLADASTPTTPAPTASAEPTATEPTSIAQPPAAGTTIDDVTVATELLHLENYERPPVPADALVADKVVNFATGDPDAVLVELEAAVGPDQLVVSGDFSGCILLAVWALPETAGVSITYEMHPSVDCAVAIEYRAMFVIDRRGSNSLGAWDYGEPPAIAVIEVRGSFSD